MIYALEETVEALRTARAAKGLSQRDLSAKVGTTQARISNIENGRVDLRLSGLLELARALDLEVMLVPREAVPAARGLIRSVASALHLEKLQKEMSRESTDRKQVLPAYRLDED